MRARRPNPGWFKKGGDPRRARGGGVKGRSGRKPDPWLSIVRRVRSERQLLKAARKILRDERHPAWVSCYKWVAEQGHGKA